MVEIRVENLITLDFLLILLYFQGVTPTDYEFTVEFYKDF